VFSVVNKVIEGGHEPRRFATDMLDRLRDLIVLALVPDAISTGLLSVPPDRADTLAEQSKWGSAQLTRAADIVSGGLDQMRGATSPRLLLELMCAQVLLPAAVTDERSVLARLERLETGFPERAVVSPQSPPPVYQASPAPQASPAAPASPVASASPGQAQAPAPVAPAPVAPAPVAPAPVAPAPVAPAPEAQSPVPSPAPTAPRPASPASSPQPASARGAVTADVVRQDWHHVLEMIKGKRRVAWMMLQNATVVSLDENVLMLRFPRQGDVKGFTTGQYDEMLKQALQARYGVNLVVRAVSGPDTGPGGRGPAGRGPGPVTPPPAPFTPPSPVPGPDPVPNAGQDPAPGPASSVGYGAEPNATTGPGERAASVPASVPDPVPETVASGSVAPEPAPVSRPQSVPVATAQPRAGQSSPASARPNDVPFPSDDDFDPDDEDNMSAPVSAELTGMALVQRELGGEIIAEYED
jgi:DNA polymerase-3 subunit gamma/tau